MLPTISGHIKLYNIEPKKSLGQNFIFDSNLCNKIANVVNIRDNDLILEIGPGPAGLTRAILEKNPKMLVAIEKDIRFKNILLDIEKYYKNFKSIIGDALFYTTEDIIELASNKNSKLKIVGNLPYNISTSLIIKWIKSIEHIESIHILVQKEVAERIISPPNCKEYGRISVLSQIFCNIKKEFNILPSNFYPKPKIDSTLLTFTPKSDRPSVDIINSLEKITETVFCFRRKMLKKALKALELEDKVEKNVLEYRAENLTPEDYLDLAKNFYRLNLK